MLTVAKLSIDSGYDTQAKAKVTGTIKALDDFALRHLDALYSAFPNPVDYTHEALVWYRGRPDYPTYLDWNRWMASVKSVREHLTAMKGADLRPTIPPTTERTPFTSKPVPKDKAFGLSSKRAAGATRTARAALNFRGSERKFLSLHNVSTWEEYIGVDNLRPTYSAIHDANALPRERQENIYHILDEPPRLAPARLANPSARLGAFITSPFELHIPHHALMSAKDYGGFPLTSLDAHFYKSPIGPGPLRYSGIVKLAHLPFFANHPNCVSFKVT